MGLSCSSDEFNRRADAAFGHLSNTVRVVDDLLRFDRSFPAHVRGVCSVLQAAQDAGFTFNPKKFLFAQECVKWVGYIVQHGGIGADPDKLKRQIVKKALVSPPVLTQFHPQLETMLQTDASIKHGM
jgi:hypothetical protein